jgi:hypothetical protein
MDADNAFKVRAALHQTMDQVPGPGASAEKKAVRPPVFQRNPAFPPLQAPDLDVPAEKQQRLAELLRRYRADEISPEQYHAERAKILGQ